MEKVTLDPDALESTQYSALSPQPSNAGSYSQASKFAMNKRAAQLLNRADTALTVPDEGSNTPLYGGSVGGGYGNYGASIGSGTGNYAPGTSNYGGSVGGQSSAYTAFSAGGSSGVGSASALQRGAANGNAAATTSNSTSPNRSKAPSLSNLVNKAPSTSNLLNKAPSASNLLNKVPSPPVNEDDTDDNYEAQRSSSVRDSALEENQYEDPDKPRVTAAAGSSSPVSKQGTSATDTSAANKAHKSKRESDEGDYVVPETLIKSPARPAAARPDGLNNSQHSLHALPPPPPIPLLSARGAPSSAERSAPTSPISASGTTSSTSENPVNRTPVPHSRDKSVDSEYIDMARLGPAPPPPTQSPQKI